MRNFYFLFLVTALLFLLPLAHAEDTAKTNSDVSGEGIKSYKNTTTADLSSHRAPNASAAERAQGWAIAGAQAEFIAPFQVLRPMLGVAKVYFFRPIDKFVCRVYKDRKKRKASGKSGTLREKGTVGWHAIRMRGVGLYLNKQRTRTVACDEGIALPSFFPKDFPISKTSSIAPCKDVKNGNCVE